VKHLLGAPLYGRPLALPTHIRLGRRGMPGTNTPAYYKNTIVIYCHSLVIAVVILFYNTE